MPTKEISKMRINQPFFIAALAGVVAAGCAFFSDPTSEDTSPPATSEAKNLSSAYFAGGCFWCVESDFDKVEGVFETVSGYTGGTLANPTYKQVTYEDTGHYEAVKVSYDPDIVSYEKLVDYFFRHVDPTDPDGQFCDKGDSYRTAIFVQGEEERAIVEAEIAEITESGVLPGPVVTTVSEVATFWPAEEYHQDYYTKNPIKYRYYRSSCGRDGRIDELWGED